MSYCRTGPCVTAHVHIITNFFICDSFGFKKIISKIEVVKKERRGLVVFVPEFWRTEIKEEVWSTLFFFFSFFCSFILFKLFPDCILLHVQPVMANTWLLPPTVQSLPLQSSFITSSLTPFGVGHFQGQMLFIPMVTILIIPTLFTLLLLFSLHLHLPICIYLIHLCNQNLKKPSKY